MTEAVIVSAARTPIGRARKGSLVDVDAFRLAEIAVGEAVARSGIDPADIDDIILGESLYGGGDIARHTAVVLGLTNVARHRRQPPLRVGPERAAARPRAASVPAWTPSSWPAARRARARRRSRGWRSPVASR